MTPDRKQQLRQDTANRLRKAYQGQLDWLSHFRQCQHMIDPKDARYAASRRDYYWQAKRQLEVVRKALYALEAASPDSVNARRPLQAAA